MSVQHRYCPKCKTVTPTYILENIYGETSEILGEYRACRIDGCNAVSVQIFKETGYPRLVTNDELEYLLLGN